MCNTPVSQTLADVTSVFSLSSQALLPADLHLLVLVNTSVVFVLACLAQLGGVCWQKTHKTCLLLRRHHL